MTLVDTGKRVDHISGQNALAHDSDGNPVTVSASTEVIQDYGWSNVLEIASIKYDRGDYNKTSEQPVVRVTTSDFS